MHKHRVFYFYKTLGGSTSGQTELVFNHSHEIVHDGPGEWRRTVANIITRETGIDLDRIMLDRLTLNYKGKVVEQTQTASTIDYRNNDGYQSSKYQGESDYDYAQRLSTEAAGESTVTSGDEPWDGTIVIKNVIQKSQREVELEAERADRDRTQARVTELEASGRKLHAFIVENRTTVQLVAAGLLLIGTLAAFVIQDKFSQSSAIELHHRLEAKEDSLIVAIDQHDWQLAKRLVTSLIHPDNVDMEFMEFDSWSGYPKYDEYWNKKREAYRETIQKDR